METPKSLHLFEGIGVELEYMICDRQTLAVKPIADEVLKAVAGEYTDEVELGDIAWSNELALHVIEFKTNGPVRSLRGLGRKFQESVAQVGDILKEHAARLMPTAAHPWMNPERETVLWPHAYNPVYACFDRIFGCRGHGWSNLQCTHVNLPFAGDEEFGRLHAAIRLAMPLIPAIAASSPILDGKPTGQLDTRLRVYRDNARRIPMVTGMVIPEPVYTQTDYQEKILERLYRDIAPHDPEGIIQHEWVNARGAIARFDRNTIEIRIVDIQECPAADVAVAHAVACVIRALVEERWQNVEDQMAWDTASLNRILVDTTKRAERAVITDPDYLEAFGWDDHACTARELWQYLMEVVESHETEADTEWAQVLETILSEGTLARRILDAVGLSPPPERLLEVYKTLCRCLDEGEIFHAKS